MKFEFITQENWEAAICLRPKESQYRFIRRDVVLDSLARCYVQPDTPDKFLLYLIIYQEDSIDSFLFRSYGIGCNLTSFLLTGTIRVGDWESLQWGLISIGPNARVPGSVRSSYV